MSGAFGSLGKFHILDDAVNRGTIGSPVFRPFHRGGMRTGGRHPTVESVRLTEARQMVERKDISGEGDCLERDVLTPVLDNLYRSSSGVK